MDVTPRVEQTCFKVFRRLEEQNRPGSDCVVADEPIAKGVTGLVGVSIQVRFDGVANVSFVDYIDYCGQTEAKRQVVVTMGKGD